MRNITGISLSLLLFTNALAAPTQTEDPDIRAAATESQMTQEERFQLLYSVMPITFGPDRPSPAPADIPAMAGYVPGIQRLGIPDSRETDASLGITNPGQLRPGDVATAMPSGLALASTFDPALAFAGGAMIGREARAKGMNILLGGGVNLTRDFFNGRNFEYLGEDPLLAGVMAGEAVRGTQSEGVVSTLKHFSLNAQETLRHWTDAVITEAGHRESDLLAFELAIERGQPGAIMCSYNKINGRYGCGNGHLLNDVLKGDWNYQGWVLSDWGAVHDVSYFNAGLDQQSGAQLDQEIWFAKPLAAELAAQRVTQERVSDAVRRILRSLYAVGADRPLATAEIDYPAHAKIARAAAAQGIVLLKNEGILPLADQAQTILLVGGYADIGVMSGGGSSQVTPVGGPASVIPIGGPGLLELVGKQLIVPSSPMRALQTALPRANISYDGGYFSDVAAARAKDSDLVIVFATQWQTEGLDGPSLSLPNGQDDLIAELANVNPNVVVVLETGNPVSMPWLNEVQAVIEAWYPGQEGGAAIADILAGETNPSGRLPITFPASAEQAPRPKVPGLGKPDGTQVSIHYQEGSNVGYRWYASKKHQPLFPFGYGLSYSTFEHGALELTDGATVTARFTVTNTGKRRGADTPQLYLVQAAGRPLLRLAGFHRITLNPGETGRVSMTVDPRLLADWDGDGWLIRKGRYSFAIGKSASELGPTVQVGLRRNQVRAVNWKAGEKGQR